MQGLKLDNGKPPSYLIAHDVVQVENGDSPFAALSTEDYADTLRRWWVRAGALHGMNISREDYFGVVKVLEFGAKKYAPRNWESGIAFSRVFRAAMDHHARMPYDDDETGLPHRYHFLCCYMFLAAYVARGLHQYDDRPGVGPFVPLETTEHMGGVL